MDWKRCKFIFHQFGFYIGVQTLLRIIFFLTTMHIASMQPLEVLKTFAVGFVYDVVVGFDYCVPLALLLVCLPFRWLDLKKGRYPVYVLIFLMDFFVLFVAFSQFIFWNEFHRNFNFIAVDYLVYSTEILGTFVETYNVFVIIAAFVVLLATAVSYHSTIFPHHFQPVKWRMNIAVVIAAIGLPFLFPQFVHDGWRACASCNQYNVEIAGNGAFSFVHAYLNSDLDYRTFYVVQDKNLVLQSLREQLQAPNSTFVGSEGITRIVNNKNSLSGRHPNIVVIAMDSLDPDYLEGMGDKAFQMPKLNEVAKQSYVFTNMLATGTRTVRALESISLSVPPTPGKSLLRYHESQGLQSLGEILSGSGYENEFFYGGYAYFDNMRDFYVSNGFAVHDRIKLKSESPDDETVWGVADEVLYDEVLHSLDRNYLSDSPSYSLVMTTTNHQPYRFPKGRVLVEQGSREGSVAYTDWALGDFLQKASKKLWFNNTVFVIVSDHQADIIGKSGLPVDQYRIPCLIYAPGLVAPQKNDRLISQMDLAPTLLGMLGISYTSNFVGRDINQVAPGDERAFISTYQFLGYVRGDKLVILSPGKQVKLYQIEDWRHSEYTTLDNNPSLTAEAITWYQGASDLYKIKRQSYAHN